MAAFLKHKKFLKECCFFCGTNKHGDKLDELIKKIGYIDSDAKKGQLEGFFKRKLPKYDRNDGFNWTDAQICDPCWNISLKVRQSNSRKKITNCTDKYSLQIRCNVEVCLLHIEN